MCIFRPSSCTIFQIKEWFFSFCICRTCIFLMLINFSNCSQFLSRPPIYIVVSMLVILLVDRVEPYIKKRAFEALQKLFLIKAPFCPIYPAIPSPHQMEPSCNLAHDDKGLEVHFCEVSLDQIGFLLDNDQTGSRKNKLFGNWISLFVNIGQLGTTHATASSSQPYTHPRSVLLPAFIHHYLYQ